MSLLYVYSYYSIPNYAVLTIDILVFITTLYLLQHHPDVAYGGPSSFRHIADESFVEVPPPSKGTRAKKSTDRKSNRII